MIQLRLYDPFNPDDGFAPRERPALRDAWLHNGSGSAS